MIRFRHRWVAAALLVFAFSPGMATADPRRPRGATLYLKFGCKGCHHASVLNGGPDLFEIARKRLTFAQIKKKIENPCATKRDFLMPADRCPIRMNRTRQPGTSWPG